MNWVILGDFNKKKLVGNNDAEACRVVEYECLPVLGLRPTINKISLRGYLDNSINLNLHLNLFNEVFNQELSSKLGVELTAGQWIFLKLKEKSPADIKHYLEVLKSTAQLPDEIFNNLNENIENYVLDHIYNFEKLADHEPREEIINSKLLNELKSLKVNIIKVSEVLSTIIEYIESQELNETATITGAPSHNDLDIAEFIG